MKKGITSTLAFELEIQVSDVEQVIFTFKEKVNSEEYLLQKEYPSESVIFEDNKFKCKLTQEETDSLSNTFFVEAQINLSNKSVIKSDICKKIMPPTLWTTFVEDNESSGEEEIITLTFTDYVEGGGSGGTTNYNELSNKPKFNNIEWVGNKTDTDMGIATKSELQTKADKSDTYTKEETNTFLNAKQDVVSGGNGVKIENDEISIDVESDTFLDFENGKLRLNYGGLARNTNFRGYLTQTYWNNPLASKSYVDDLMSGATKWEFVSQLPTENIDIHTIYFVPKESAETDNIYDEWVYAIQSRNPDVYDWELLGTNQVDLSNYYTKTETDTLLGGKQNALTEGYGIRIINNIISVDNKIHKLFDFGRGGTLPTDPTSIEGREVKILDVARVVDDTPPYDVHLYIANSITPTIEWVDYFEYMGVASKVDLSSKQDTIDSTHKLSADLVDDTNSTNKFVSATEKQGWNAKADTTDIPTNVSELNNDSDYQTSSDVASAIADKEDKTTISTDTTSTTVSLTLADNHEYRYTQDLTSLTLTMPNGDFISSVVFSSGSTPTSMTYDSSIKWSGDDVTNGQFVPSADKDYDIMMYYNGLNINGIVRGA